MGDLLTSTLSPAIKLAGPRRGLRRGTSATRWYDLGCRLETSDTQAAMFAYERAVAGCPSLADAHNNLGRLLHDSGSVASAESSYRLAICADPTVSLYWFNLGVAVEDQGRFSEAAHDYAQAIALDAGAADAHYNLARLLDHAARRVDDREMQQRAVRHLLRYRELTARTVVCR